MKMKKSILLTGATGFLGSHLVKKLLKERQDVVILKRSFSDISRIAQDLDRLKVYDVDRISELEQIFQDQHIDVIIHTATCYGRNNESIQQIVDTNLGFSLRLLETAVSFHASVFLNTDTFFNTGTIHSKYLNGYALSKKQFSEWGKQFASMGKIQFIDAALEHMYGEGDSKLKFVTFLVESLLTAGEQKRDFIYVGDVVEAYWHIFTHLDSTKPYQRYEVGTGKATSIKEFAIKAKELLHSRTKLNFGAVPYKEGEIMDSRADISDLQTLGWKPDVDIEKGILLMENYINKENILNTAFAEGGNL